MNYTIDQEFKNANRKLTKQERDGLYKAIAEDGVRDGSLVCAQIEGDPVLYLADGHNTVEICQEQGVKTPSPDIKLFKSRDDVLAWIHERSRGRRNLTTEEMAAARQKRITQVVADRKDGMSTRVIAEKHGISQPQVLRDLESTQSGDTHVSPDGDSGKTKGKDGKEYPATKPVMCARCKRVGQIKDCQKCAELVAKRESKAARKSRPKTSVKGDADEGELEQFLDAEGQKVPADAVPAFQAAKDLEAVCRELNEIIRRVEAIAKGPGGRLIRFESFKQQIADAKGNIWANRATHVCPYCKGTGKANGKECEACKGDGWVARHIYAAAPGVTKHK